MQDHSQISPVTGLPIIAVLTVNGREIRISSSRPYDRAFLQDWADRVARKPRQSAAEFIRSQSEAAEAKDRDSLE